MATDTRWIALAQRAGRAVRALDDAGPGSKSLSVVFQIAGVVQGAVHAHVSSATPDQARQFAQALEAEAKKDGFLLRPIWFAPTQGPHQGDRLGGVVLSLEKLELPQELQRLHINQTIVEAQKLSESSVLAIGDEMRRVYELARNQVDGLKKVAAQFSENGDGQAHANIATTIEQLSAQMRAFGQQILERTQRQARDIEQARVWTNDIVKLGQAIADIASNARILTFNARLESARIGEAGRGFAVIAGSIQELATSVRQTNNAVSQLAENLAAALPRLGVDAQETSRDARESVGQLEQQLLDVQTRLAGVRNDSWEALSDSSSMAQELQSRANTVIHHLQFQDRTSQMLAEAAQQAAAVVSIAGLVEQQVDEQVIRQVGELGRKISGEEGLKAAGSVELF
jgi:hypothetical protein